MLMILIRSMSLLMSKGTAFVLVARALKPLDNFYLFRHTGDGVYECTKFEYDRSEPVETYELKPGRYINARDCSCPSRYPCKHLKALFEDRPDDLTQVYWDDVWWQRGDIMPFEEFVNAVFA
jgi:hypothetical protein